MRRRVRSRIAAVPLQVTWTSPTFHVFREDVYLPMDGKMSLFFQAGAGAVPGRGPAGGMGPVAGGRAGAGPAGRPVRHGPGRIAKQGLMGHGKLKKFAENETFRCLLQPDASSVLAKPEGSRELVLRDHAIKGNWNRDMFEKPQPIVLELGCGKGDYTIALARRHPEMNFIGVDIKGARLWKGAKEATEEKMGNVAFLRTRIEFIDAFFGPGKSARSGLRSPTPSFAAARTPA